MNTVRVSEKNSYKQPLTLCILRNFSCFLPSADFLQNHLFPKILSEIPSEYTDEARRFVEPDLGLNCLQKLSVVNVNFEKVSVESVQINFKLATRNIW